MSGQLREFRSRIKSVKSTTQITRAMELIAASRITKARARVDAQHPYVQAITRAVSAVANHVSIDHVLTTEADQIRRIAVLVITSDRGLAGAYAQNVIKESEQLVSLLEGEGKEVLRYVTGKKGLSYLGFREIPVVESWVGDSDAPLVETAREITKTLLDVFTKPYEDGGVDELHVVYTRFVSMVSQVPEVLRLLPLEVVEGIDDQSDAGTFPLYEFEPSPHAVLDEALPRYVESRVYDAMLQAAASELAARQRAMKSATDNGGELVKTLTRKANTARQAEITQEITEIVGGANALASADKD